MEKRKSSIKTVSRDAPTVSPRFIYRSTTTHDDRATFHHAGAMNAHDASTIRYGASMIQAGMLHQIKASQFYADLGPPKHC